MRVESLRNHELGWNTVAGMTLLSSADKASHLRVKGVTLCYIRLDLGSLQPSHLAVSTVSRWLRPGIFEKCNRSRTPKRMSVKTESNGHLDRIEKSSSILNLVIHLPEPDNSGAEALRTQGYSFNN